MNLFDNVTFFDFELSSFSLGTIISVCYISYYLIFIKQYPRIVGYDGKFREFIEDNLSITKHIYWPLLWGFESTVQTIIGSEFRIHRAMTYEREFFTLSDNGEIILDWADPSLQNSNVETLDSTPIVVFLPGLTGCSQSNYITQMVGSVIDSNYRAVVYNYRGKGGSKLKTPRTYCAMSTQDFTEVIQHIHSKFPNAPLMGCGISLGGMILFNYLAQAGRSTPLTAAFVVSIVWNVAASVISLERPLNRILFNRNLAQALASDVRTNSHMFQSSLDLDPVYSSVTIREFDTHFTAPVFGYSSVDEYYTSASPNMKVQNIKIPLLCLNSADDVFAPGDSIPIDEIQRNPYITMILTTRGGHVGFLEGLWPRRITLMERILTQYSTNVFNNIEQFRKIINFPMGSPAVSTMEL